MDQSIQVPVNVTLFGNRFLSDAIKLRRNPIVLECHKTNIIGVSIRRDKSHRNAEMHKKGGHMIMDIELE